MIMLLWAFVTYGTWNITLPAESLHDLVTVDPYTYQDPVVTEIVRETGVPIEILNRLIASESSWRPTVTSCIREDGSMDIGLAQINSLYLDYFTLEYMEGALNPLHPVDSLWFAARYLARLKARLGSWEAAVVAYKIGPSRVASAPSRLWDLARKVVRGI
jgi:soluble lytic murein transglycosylase-like protein